VNARDEKKKEWKDSYGAWQETGDLGGKKKGLEHVASNRLICLPDR